MSVDPEQIASDWIHYTRFDPNKSPDDVQERAWVLYDAARREPMVAWAAIKSVIGRYSEVELFGSDDTEAKRLLANIAAGPLEGLLAEHGSGIIAIVEAEARRDRRMFWTLGCVWRNGMSDDVWARVQRAAGNISR